MSPKRMRDLGKCIYLLDKSRKINYYEPLSSKDQQNYFVNYVRDLIDKIEQKTLQEWEVQAHLWALHKTLEIRFKKVKDRRWLTLKAR